MPTVSVLLPNYNHARYLPQCLDAFLGQTRPPDEIVVVDDGSTDDSLAVLRGYSERHPQIRVLENGTNRGVGYTLWRATKEAQNEFVYWGAADDTALPRLLEELCKLADRYPQADLVSANYEIRVQEDRIEYVVPSGIRLTSGPEFLNSRQFAEALRCATNPAIGLFLHRRHVLLEQGRLDVDWYDDIVHNLITAFRTGLAHTPEPLVCFRVDPTTYSNAGRRQAGRDIEALRKMMRVFLSASFRDVVPLLTRSRILCLHGFKAVQAAAGDPECHPLLPHLLTWKTFRSGLGSWFKTRLRRYVPAALRKTVRGWRPVVDQQRL